MRLLLSILLLAAGAKLRAEPPKPVTLDLWPGAAPGESPTATPPDWQQCRRKPRSCRH